MAIKKETLDRAIEEANRFLRAAHTLKSEHGDTDFECFWDKPREQASVKRASMDLTRCLADLRNER